MGIFRSVRLFWLIPHHEDHNRLAHCTPSADMQSLRVLRLSHNQLATLDLSLFPRLRSFYADGNRIESLWRSRRHSNVRLEYLSLRDQDVRHLNLSHDDLRDVKRLYISGKLRDSAEEMQTNEMFFRESSYKQLLSATPALLLGVSRSCRLFHV